MKVPGAPSVVEAWPLFVPKFPCVALMMFQPTSNYKQTTVTVRKICMDIRRFHDNNQVHAN